MNTLTLNTYARLLRMLEFAEVEGNWSAIETFINGILAGTAGYEAGNALELGGVPASKYLTVDTPISKVINITRDTTLATGTVAITGVGFKPSSLEMICATSGANGSYSIGFFDGSTYSCKYTNEVPNTQIATTYLGVIGTSPGNTLITVDSFDPDGCTLRFTRVSSPTGIISIGMRFLR